jgi:hypothetical protein
VHPTLYPACLYCSYYYSVSLFSWVEVGLFRGLCCSGPGLSVRVLHTAKVTLSASSQAAWLWVAGGWWPAAGGLGALLIFPFNVKWRCSALPGGVEGSKFCLFSVVLPAKCVSSVSPRFHYRRHTICFLPLAAILESQIFFKQRLDIDNVVRILQRHRDQ